MNGHPTKFYVPTPSQDAAKDGAPEHLCWAILCLVRGLGAGDDAVVVVLVERDDTRGAEVVLRVLLARKIFGDAAVGTVADQHQACRHCLGDAAEDLDNILNALDGAEVGKVDEQTLVGFGKARAHGGYQLGVADVDVAVDEVADDLDLGVDLEGFAGSVAQIGGDRGDSVGLLDAELCDGQLRAVEADERDVGAVQGGDEGEMESA